MKTLKKSILLLASLAVMSLASCVNDGLTEGPAAGAGKVAALEQQAASMEATVGELNAFQTVAEGHEASLDAAVEALEAHIADLRDGAALMDGTMATFAMQKKMAGVLGAIEASDEEGTLKKQISNLEKGIASWVGKHFDAYYPAAKAEALAEARLAALELDKQKIYVEAILSDVEAGLRKDADKEELTALAAAVNGNMESAEELAVALATTAADVHAEYAGAVETAFTDPENFDLPALKSFNSAVASTLSAADNTLAGLIARVEACETQLADIKNRLAELETGFADLEKLLGMIQSVTFMSDYSANTAVAYYNLATTKNSEGLLERTPVESLTLKYIVRPAASASALADEALWNSSVKVIGYYAGRIEQSSVTMNEFKITGIEADATSGIVTVTVQNDLSTDFYFKKTGVKMALSVATGKTDLTTTFVEVVPKDASSTVYVEDLSISTDYVEVDDGLTTRLRATLTPDDATESELTWTTSNADVAEVSSDGIITAKSVGEATITVTTKGINEWGLTLSKTCTVRVLPNIKIVGSTSVEKGGSIELRLESPDYIAPEYVTWSLANDADKSFVNVGESGTTVTVTAKASYYNTTDARYEPVYINCSVNGTTLTHELYVIEVQPKSLTFDNLGDVSSMSLKIGTEASMAATINPSEVDPGKFKVNYITYGGTDESIATLGFSDGKIEAKGVGSQTFMAQVAAAGSSSYFYPSGSYLTKYLTVNVEPYWVESISLPSTLTIAPNTTAAVTPTFTSDVPGNPPSYPDLNWTSSNPEIVTVNEQTGEITALAEGESTITATTASKWAVPTGSAPKTASIYVVVKKQTDPISVGDYYYSDGTWSTQLNSSKTLVGIVCHTGIPSSADNKIPAKFTNGYVVSVDEITAALDDDANVSPNNFHTWATNRGYYAIKIGDGTWNAAVNSVAQGYSNTLAFSELTNEIAQTDLGTSWSGSSYGGWSFYLSGGALEQFRTAHTVDSEKNTTWYVPSQKELTMLSGDALTAVNNALRNAGKTEISNTNYKTSSYNTYGNAVIINPVGQSVTYVSVSTEGPIRLFLAF